jgi:hypothetical protein
MKLKGRHMKRYLILILLIMASGCGVQSKANSGEGTLSLSVKNSKSFNPNIEHGLIVNYQILITGPGIKTSITTTFDGTATSGKVDGIPAGENREVIVTAINPNQMTIRQGEASGVKIIGGQTTDIDITLESVPIFTNLTDGNTLDNTRLIFKIFADSPSSVIVEKKAEQEFSPLINPATSLAEIKLDVNTGLGQLVPALQPVGAHTFQTRDLNTNRSSQVTITLTDGTKRRPAPLYSAGDRQEPDKQRKVSSGLY